jgi:hypothetical protein
MPKRYPPEFRREAGGLRGWRDLRGCLVGLSIVLRETGVYGGAFWCGDVVVH